MTKIAFVAFLLATIACKQISGETDAEELFNDLSKRGNPYENHIENVPFYKTDAFKVEDDGEWKLFPGDDESVGMLSKRSGGGCSVQSFDIEFSFNANIRDNGTGGCGTTIKTCQESNNANIFDIEYSIRGDVANKVHGSQSTAASLLNSLNQAKNFLKKNTSKNKIPFYLFFNLLQKFDIGFDVSGSLAGSDSICTKFSGCSAMTGNASNDIPEVNALKLLQYLLFGIGMNNIFSSPIYLYAELLSAFKVELSLIGGVKGSGKTDESAVCITITSTSQGAGTSRKTGANGSIIFLLPLYLPDTFIADLTLNANVKGNQS